MRIIEISPDIPDPEACAFDNNLVIGKLVAPTHFLYTPEPGGSGSSCDRYSSPGAWGRIHPELRRIAQAADAKAAIRIACRKLYEARFAAVTPKPRNFFAFACADLAVTGRRAYQNLRAVNFSALEREILTEISAVWPGAVESNIRSCISAVYERVLSIAWCLRGPSSYRNRERNYFGWITVSGEDDPPHRPVNVLSAPYPQYEIDVPMDIPTGSGGRSRFNIKTRFLVASPTPVVEPGATPVPSLPPDPPIQIPPADEVIIFIHGHSSRAEECLDVAPALIEEGRRRGRNYSVIAMDLPCCGYSTMFDSSAPRGGFFIADNEASRTPGRFPILDFLEEFICQFVERVHQEVPIRDRVVAVIGGSLGGNMSLRLGRRDQVRYPYLRTVIPWSAASVWDSYDHPHDLVDDVAKTLAKNACFDSLSEPETDGSRAKYFHDVFLKILPFPNPFYRIPRQPEQWYRDNWQPCKQLHIEGSILERQEIYHPFFRQMHWRIALEQLRFSHNLTSADGRTPLYLLNKARTLLLTGSADNYDFTNIFDATRLLASRMGEFPAGRPGRCLLLRDTGHSIHNERPKFLAREIVQFLLE